MDGDVALAAAIAALGLLTRAQSRLGHLEQLLERLVGPEPSVAPRGTRAETQVTWFLAILSLLYLVGDTILRIRASGLPSGG